MKPVPRSVNLEFAGLFKHPLTRSARLRPALLFQELLTSALPLAGGAEPTLIERPAANPPPLIWLLDSILISGLPGTLLSAEM
jgi:hypothetical protein